MERMKQLKLMEDYESNWRYLNQDVYNTLSQHKHYITKVEIRAQYGYCEECDKEMYWPILHVDTRMKYYDTTNSCRYEDYQIDAYWFDNISSLGKLEGICNRINKDYYALRDTLEIYNCPFCGENSLVLSGGKYRGNFGSPVYEIYSTYDPKNPKYNDFSDQKLETEIEDRIKELRKQRLKNIEEDNREEAEEYAAKRIEDVQEQFEEYSEVEVWSKVNSAAVKNSVESLKTFILDILKMETSIIGFQQRLEQLYKQKKMAELQQKMYVELDEKRRKQLSRQISETKKELESYSPSMAIFGIKDPEEPIKVAEPVLQKPGLFNKKKVEAENKRLMDDYQAKLNEYREKYKIYEVALSENKRLYAEKKEEGKKELEKRLEEKNKELTALSQETVLTSPVESIIEKEISMAEKALEDTYTQRNNFYNTDIIYVKYRNPVALASFCEYLVSGRCTELEGTNGAYNIYENEIRLDHITEQLDEVIVSLEQIKKNQFTIYSELKEMNSTLKSLDSSLNKAIRSIEQNSRMTNEKLEEISNNTAVAAYYSKMNAYYTKKTAETAKAIGWLIALK